EDGRGSGWVGRNVTDVSKLDASSSIDVAIRKARESADAKALEPGKYTVVLEPHAAAGLIPFMMYFLDPHPADEGRSLLPKKGGGNKLGEQVYDPRVSIWADPADPDALVLPWDGEGMARKRMPVIQDGKVANMLYSRYWAQQQGREAVATPGNLIMSGGSKSTAD